MQPDVIRFNGSYRYADRATLASALSRARRQLADDDLESGRAWLRCFVTSGTDLVVNLVVAPGAQDRVAAANVFSILAHEALEGAVETHLGPPSIDPSASSADE